MLDTKLTPIFGEPENGIKVRFNEQQSQGFTVIRFTNDQILSDPDAVARAIQKEVEVLQNARGADS